MIVAGIMSGTSLDGIDVAIVEITGEGWNKKVKTLAHSTTPYPRAVREALLAVSNAGTHTAQIGMLGFLLPELYAKAVRGLCLKAKIPLHSLQLVGCHGQTILHIAEPVRFLGHRLRCTLQIGDGSVLAERLSVPVVSDFRPRDMAAGGQELRWYPTPTTFCSVIANAAASPSTSAASPISPPSPLPLRLRKSSRSTPARETW